MTAATPAEYGAAWLDEHDPGWASRINLSKLDLRIPSCCILGQLYSENSRNGYTRMVTKHGQEMMFRLGFDVDEDVEPFDMWPRFAELTAEWSRLVAARQAQTTPNLDPVEVTVP